MNDHSNTPKIPLSINKINSLVVDAQIKDIKLYTKGHLNEENLWRPPEQRHYQTWESANKGHILSRPPHMLNKRTIDENLVNDMCDTLADFTLGTSIPVEKRRRVVQSSKDVYVEELKLPNIIVAKKLPDSTPRASNISQLSKNLPKLGQSLNIDDCLPKSDIEIAYKIIDGPFNGATKQEKFKNFKKFEETVIQKQDLTNSNVLNETNEMRRLEEKLAEKLQQTGVANKNDANFHRLQIYGSIFDEIILEKNIFGDLLHDIKKEYDLYLNHLLDKQPSSGSQLMHQAELAERSGLSKKGEINKADEEIEQLEDIIDDLFMKQDELKRKIFEEKTFYDEKVDEINRKIYHSYTESIAKSASNHKREYTIADRIDSTREQILTRINEMTNINEQLNKDYVPNAVINNLLQSIKDTEIESEKLLKQNEFLDAELKQSEAILIDYLIKYDNTEFAQENVDYLIKTLKNLDVIQLDRTNETNDKTAKQQDTNNERQIKSSTVQKQEQQNKQQKQRNDDFLNQYDDYFS